MALLILAVGLLGGAVAYWLFFAVANWLATGRFRAVRRG